MLSADPQKCKVGEIELFIHAAGEHTTIAALDARNTFRLLETCEETPKQKKRARRSEPLSAIITVDEDG